MKDLKPSTCFSPGAALLSPANSSDQNSVMAQLALLHGYIIDARGLGEPGAIVRRSIEVLKPLRTTGATKAARRAAVTAVLWRNMAIDVFLERRVRRVVVRRGGGWRGGGYRGAKLGGIFVGQWPDWISGSSVGQEGGSRDGDMVGVSCRRGGRCSGALIVGHGTRCILVKF